MDYAFISLCTAAGCCDGFVRKQRNKKTELQKRADRADQSVLFFLAGANFWEKHAKNRRKHAKTGENTRKQAKNRRFFGANVLGGKIGRC